MYIFKRMSEYYNQRNFCQSCLLQYIARLREAGPGNCKRLDVLLASDLPISEC